MKFRTLNCQDRKYGPVIAKHYAKASHGSAFSLRLDRKVTVPTREEIRK